MLSMLAFVVNPLPVGETIECHTCCKELHGNTAIQDEDSGLFYCSNDCVKDSLVEEEDFLHAFFSDDEDPNA